jgi:hypothetical protein
MGVGVRVRVRGGRPSRRLGTGGVGKCRGRRVVSRFFHVQWDDTISPACGRFHSISSSISTSTLLPALPFLPFLPYLLPFSLRSCGYHNHQSYTNPTLQRAPTSGTGTAARTRGRCRAPRRVWGCTAQARGWVRVQARGWVRVRVRIRIRGVSRLFFSVLKACSPFLFLFGRGMRWSWSVVGCGAEQAWGTRGEESRRI